jgi:hypothetical protein
VAGSLRPSGFAGVLREAGLSPLLKRGTARLEVVCDGGGTLRLPPSDAVPGVLTPCGDEVGVDSRR